MKNIYFFATPTDIRRVLVRFEGNACLKFVEAGTKSSPGRNEYVESLGIEKLGVASNETGSQSQGYLVTLRDTKVEGRMLTSRTGAKHWYLNSADVCGSIGMTPAGLWKDMLLPGNTSTVHDDPVAQQLMRWFMSALKAEGFVRAGMFWVGKEALHMLDSGVRLSTTAEQSPPEFNLRPDHVKRAHKRSGKPMPNGVA